MCVHAHKPTEKALPVIHTFTILMRTTLLKNGYCLKVNTVFLNFSRRFHVEN